MAQLIQVDLEASELGRLRPVQVPIVADCREVLLALLADDAPWPDRSDWLAEATAAKALPAQLFGNVPDELDGRVYPYHAAREALVAIPEGAVVVLDGGEAPLWATLSINEISPHRVLGLGYMGFLGIGPGFAIGAQLGEPDRTVLQITGDGAFGFHLQELDTMVRHNLPIVTVVLNNACWGMSIHGQEAIYGADAGVISRLADTDYDRVAQAFGAYGERVSTRAEIRPAIQRALGSGLPAVINIATAADVVHPATVTMVGDLDAEDKIVVPYYENLTR